VAAPSAATAVSSNQSHPLTLLSWVADSSNSEHHADPVAFSSSASTSTALARTSNLTTDQLRVINALQFPQLPRAQHFAALAKAAACIHAAGYVHLDLRLQNAFVNIADELFITDFGSAVEIGKQYDWRHPWAAQYGPTEVLRALAEGADLPPPVPTYDFEIIARQAYAALSYNWLSNSLRIAVQREPEEEGSAVPQRLLQVWSHFDHISPLKGLLQQACAQPFHLDGFIKALYDALPSIDLGAVGLPAGEGSIAMTSADVGDDNDL
jgi:hypothetical protein